MMDRYKDSKIGKFPNDWNISQIQDVLLEYQNGYAFSAKGYVDNGISIISMAMISLKGRFQMDELKCKKWDSREELNLNRYILKKGDLIIAMTDVTPNKDLIGKMAVINIDGKFLLNQRVGWLKLNNKLIDTTYLSYIGNSEKWLKNCRNMASQGAQANIGTKQITESYIPLPPLKEQQKIAEILSTVDDKIEVIDQQITETQALKKGLMQRLLTKGIGHSEFKDTILGEIPKSWEIVKLSEICDEIFLGLTSKVDYVESGGFPFVRATDINSGRLSFDNIKYISEKQHKKLTVNRLTKKGDVLVSKSGTLGTCAIVDVDTEFSTYESIITIQPKVNLLLNKFLLQILQDTDVQKRMIGARVGGIVGHLNLMTFRKLTIPLPKTEEQLQISDLLSTMDEKLNILSEKKTYYQELKQGLMQQLLTGKIRVTI